MSLPSIHPLSDKICINCGNSFVTGVLLSKTISPYCDNCSPQATHPCPGCVGLAKELADIAAVLRTSSSGDTFIGKEVSRIANERDNLRAGILRVIEDYPRDIKQDAEEALRALVAGTVAPVSGDSDLRARIEEIIREMEGERGDRLQYWIISLRKIVEEKEK